MQKRQHGYESGTLDFVTEITAFYSNLVLLVWGKV